MRLFLDSSVALAACGRPHGASRAIVNAAAANGWELVSSGYSVAEVTRNLGKLPGNAAVEWQSVASRLRLVRDVWTNDRPAVFGVAKDRPVLFTAAAWADVLLTLDTADFLTLLGNKFYALHVLTPGMFLEWQRATGQLGLAEGALAPQGSRPASHSPPRVTGPSWMPPPELFDFTRRNGWTQLASDCGLREFIQTRPRPEKERRS